MSEVIVGIIFFVCLYFALIKKSFNIQPKIRNKYTKKLSWYRIW